MHAKTPTTRTRRTARTDADDRQRQQTANTAQQDDLGQQTADAPQQGGTDPHAADGGEPADDGGNGNQEKEKKGDDDAGGQSDGEKGDGGAQDEVAPLPGPLADAVATMGSERDELREVIERERAELEQTLAPKVKRLAELEGFIAAIERQHNAANGNGVSGNGVHASRGRNWEKIQPHLADGRPKTSAELAELTGIGRGSLDRTLNNERERGKVTKTNTGWQLPNASK